MSLFLSNCEVGCFLHKTLFGFCWPNHCLSFTVLRHVFFGLLSLSRSKSNLIYYLHPLEGWTVLEVLVAVISTGRKEGKLQERKRTVIYFLLFIFLLYFYRKEELLLAAESRTELRGSGKPKGLSYDRTHLSHLQHLS